jgi:hypothetical protein
MTDPTNVLPDHNGEAVTKAQIKFSGVGTGFTGLDTKPIYMDLDDIGYFVMKASAVESPSAKRDGKGVPFWLNRLGVEVVAPISKDLAEKALQDYAAEIERAKEEADGQSQLFAEHEAEAREQLDQDGTPADIADAAAQRAKNQP